MHHSTYHNAQSLPPHNTTFYLSDTLVTYLPLSANYELLQFICAQPDTTHFLIMLRQPHMLQTFPGCHPFPVNTYGTFYRPNLWRLKAERNTHKWTFTSMSHVFPNNSNSVHFLTQCTSQLYEDSQLLRCNAVSFTFQPLKMNALHSFKLPGNTNTSTYCHIAEHQNTWIIKKTIVET